MRGQDRGRGAPPREGGLRDRPDRLEEEHPDQMRPPLRGIRGRGRARGRGRGDFFAGGDRRDDHDDHPRGGDAHMRKRPNFPGGDRRDDHEEPRGDANVRRRTRGGAGPDDHQRESDN